MDPKERKRLIKQATKLSHKGDVAYHYGEFLAAKRAWDQAEAIWESLTPE